MALFSASESVYLSSFLSSVDLDSSINHDGSIDPNLAEQIPHLQGSEALAKATKDLMSLDVPLASARPQSAHSAGQPAHAHLHPAASSPPSYWPSFPPGEQSSAAGTGQQFPQGLRSSSPARYLSRGLSTPSDPLRSGPQGERGNTSVFTAHLGQPSQHIAPLRGFDHPSSSSSTGGFTLPPISTSGSGFPNGDSPTTYDATRPSAVPSAASAPSVLSTTSTKRPLPASSEPATDPSSSKRARPSPSSATFPASGSDLASAAGPSGGPRTRARQNSSSVGPQRRPCSASRQQQQPSQSTPGDNDDTSARDPDGKDAVRRGSTSGAGVGGGGGGSGGGGTKGALLSPSQKRANHIQSEQKRRANIRRGYEALCEVVPALREAIRAEDERERAEAGDGGGGDGDGTKGKARAGGSAGASASAGGGGGADRGKRKRKSESGDRPDGRAGPRSENVVLSKTIEYITSLLAERTALAQRLEIARGILPLGHPAAHVDPRHLDASGTPLWEREWNGGMDLDAGAAGDDGSEDEG
ncbi:hypothetical protein C8Q77DRAFT_1155534 [Trametes polyzona]|nr:hypothetical protein C8Q77DRAFT_1155534 [Trametes polyzona]